MDSEQTHACLYSALQFLCCISTQEIIDSSVFPLFSHWQYLPTDLQDMPHFPDISKDNPYLMSHSDGSVIDAKEYAIEVNITVFAVIHAYHCVCPHSIPVCCEDASEISLGCVLCMQQWWFTNYSCFL